MPRFIKQRVPAYRHYKPRDLACVDIGGQRFYLGPYKSRASYEEYDRLIETWLANNRSLPREDSEAGCLTVVEVIAQYLRHANAYYQKNGRPTAEYECIVSAVKPLKRLYGRQRADEFGPKKLEVVRNQFLKADNSRGYINKQVARIRRAFRWAVGEELIPETVHRALCTLDPLKAGRCDARESKPVEAVSDSIVNATLPHLSETIADMVRLQRASGMRPGEVVQLRPADIDRSDAIWRYIPQSHKCEHHKKRRVVYLGKQSQKILARYLLRAETEFCFKPSEVEAKRRAELTANRKTPMSSGNRIGTNRKRRPKRSPGDMYDVKGYRQCIHRACRRAKVPQWSPHKLRHAAASVIRRKFGEEAARVCLGHSRLDATRLYGEVDERLAREVAAKIG